MTGPSIADEAMADANTMLAADWPDIDLGDLADVFELGVWLGVAATVGVLQRHGLVRDRDRRG